MRKPPPVIPGQRCPAERTGKSSDPKVRVTETYSNRRNGFRTCGKCGLENVPVQQNWGAKHSAWHYEWHTVPGGEK